MQRQMKQVDVGMLVDKMKVFDILNIHNILGDGKTYTHLSNMTVRAVAQVRPAATVNCTQTDPRFFGSNKKIVTADLQLFSPPISLRCIFQTQVRPANGTNNSG